MLYGIFWPKTDFLSFLANIFKNKKLIKTKNKTKFKKKMQKAFIYVCSMICVLYYKLLCMLYGIFWPKTDFLSFLANIFKNKKLIKTKNKTKFKKNAKSIPWYMLLDHVDSFGNFLKFLPKHMFFTPIERKEPKRCFYCFLKNTVPCKFPLLKLYNFYIIYLI